MDKISTKGLTREVREAIIKFNNSRRRGMVRAIAPEDTAAIVAAARLGLRLRREDDHTLTVKFSGGFIANSYKWRGTADRALLRMDLRAGTWEFCIARSPAERRPHGEGERLVVRLLRGDQTQGRLVLR